MRFFERDLRVKITAILLAFVVVSVAAAVLVSHVLVTRIIDDNIVKSALDSANLTRDIVEAELERRSAAVGLLADFPIIRDPTTTPDAKSQALGTFVKGYPLGEGAVFTDTAGNIVAGTGSLATLGSAGQTPWFVNAQSAVPSFTLLNSEPQQIASFEVPVLAVSAPARDPRDQIYSYVVVFTSLSDINKSMSEVQVERTGHGFVVSSSGKVISGSLFPVNAHPSARESSAAEALVSRITSGGSGSASIGFSGETYLLAYTPVGQAANVHPELDWAVGVIIPRGEAFAPANRVAFSLFGLGALVLVCAVVAAFFLGRSISRPIDELVKNAEKVGTGDLTGEVVIRTRDQIGSLAASFLRMRDYLRGALAGVNSTANRMSMLAEEQSAASGDVFSNADEIVDSVVVLAKNMEVQTEKLRAVLGYAESLPEEVRSSPVYQEVIDLLSEAKILAEVGANKAVEIASSTQDQRAAARDVTATARRLSEMANELREIVQKFKL